MILHGNQRGGYGDLATHLMKPENEKVVVHDLSGFVADDLQGHALQAASVLAEPQSAKRGGCFTASF